MQAKTLALGLGAGAVAVASAVRQARKSAERGRIVVVGGGTGGLAVAARLCRELKEPDVTIIEPSEKHAYQPGWTLVSSGVFPKEHFIRSEGELIPDKAKWLRDRVVGFLPEENKLETESGRRVGYDYLVVCPGHQLDYGKIEGLDGHLGKNGLYSNYTGEGAEKTWEGIRNFRGGTALFVEPAGPIKCGGAPQKIAYMADSHWRRSGVRGNIYQMFLNGKPSIFSAPLYAEALTEVMERKEIDTRFKHNLVSVDAEKKEATFAVDSEDTEQAEESSRAAGGRRGVGAPPKMSRGEGTVTISYDLLHFCPPQSAPDFIKESPLSNDAGYVEVDKHTLQHTRYPNVFALGDASNLPTSKTGAAIRKQAPVVVHNLIKLMGGADLKKDSEDYHGYTSCPLVTDYGKMLLAEFDYSLKPRPTFPPWEHDSTKETYTNWLLKTQGLPNIYWHGMLKGLA
ncbi:Pyridine nucleotide-disulfide oxidoreductase (plasmid) [Rubrobacter radiotolerans]|uniref:FAD/NAD(P)-binding oxidoreductase n=1 Tax=Rubrobacter radiotolerans TaxID=42256 RepID=A0A023X882_RUBRA|nr:FAD/NAD(P)-binding oxidoreductase [Rubrobacter radiotolerans]AHY48255.1 Pyridine nucleotide-disulfide oxidoreductase [Rubrobacter radiotolerans]MDX5895528.1 FAD/NAD(P)-binding oxidoreductase [Rubrobacter radiotolerans]SMC01452.1 sulfide:quinone oxidoreductase [Rubrobacter radiotolerans DSM 5868]